MGSSVSVYVEFENLLNIGVVAAFIERGIFVFVGRFASSDVLFRQFVYVETL